MLRFDTDVLAEAPALTIWQVGTNAVFMTTDTSFPIWRGDRCRPETVKRTADGCGAVDCNCAGHHWIAKIAGTERMVALITEAAAKPT